MVERDYYEVLGIERRAMQKEVKRAYREKARRFHPDVAGGDPSAEEAFKEVNEAYAVLGDERRRRMYDHFGHAGAKAAAGGFAQQAAAAEEYIGDFFREFIGRKRAQKARGRDLRYTLEVSFEDAAKGITSDVDVPHPFPCAECAGSGASPGTAPRPCPTCHGVGEIRLKRGFFSVGRDCGRCQATGIVIDKPCDACAGSGKSVGTRTLPVEIPAAVEDGRVFHIKGAGEPGTDGGDPGDLSVHVRIRPHPFFRRGEGGTVDVEVPVGIETASLGGEIEVPCLEGSVRMKIPPGTQTGRTFRLRNKGIRIPGGGGEVADQHVVIVVETPVALDGGAADALGAFRDAVAKGEVRYARRDEFLRKMAERDG